MSLATQQLPYNHDKQFPSTSHVILNSSELNGLEKKALSSEAECGRVSGDSEPSARVIPVQTE